MYVTLMACAASLWMAVVRFGYPKDDLIQILWVSLVCLLAIVLVAAPIALLLRWLNEKQHKKVERKEH